MVAIAPDTIHAALLRAPKGRLTPEQQTDFDAVMAHTAGSDPVPGEKVSAMLEARRLFEEKYGSAVWLRGLGMPEHEVQRTLEEWARDERDDA